MSDKLKPWELVERSPEFVAAPWVSVYRDRVRLPGGQLLNDFYWVTLPDFAVVTAITPDRELVMVRGYKHGLGRVSLLSPAGMVEPGEPC